VVTSVSSMDDLETRILELEKVQAIQIASLKSSAFSIVEGFSPANMVRTALKEVVQSPDLKKSAINTAIGIGAGFLGRKLFVGRSNNLFKKISGSAVQFMITNFVRKRIPEMQENGQKHSNES
jgi:hypothetical protein